MDGLGDGWMKDEKYGLKNGWMGGLVGGLLDG